MVIYVPGTEETDPKKQNMSLQQIGGATTTLQTSVAANTANIATNTTNIATNTAAIATNTANIAALSTRIGSTIGLGSNGSALSTGATIYFGIGTSSTTDNAFYVIPVAGVLSTFRYQGTGSPGVGQTFTHTLRKNTTDTALTCSNTGGAITASDTTHTVAVAAGDFISIKSVASASAANSGSNFFGVVFTPT